MVKEVSEKEVGKASEVDEKRVKPEEKENKMGTMPMSKLLMSMSLPMICSMLVQALYNVVDSVFVSRIVDDIDVAADSGTAALNGVGMAFPFQTLLIAFGTGTCVGVNAILSKALGEKDQNTVEKSAHNGIFLCFLNYLLFLIIGVFFSEILIKSQGGDGLSLSYGSDYLRIICLGSIFVYIQLMFERLLQSTGRTIYTMFTQGIGAVINIVLDPILIFGLFGAPELKVKGAAIATITGQFVAAILAVVINVLKNPEIHLSIKKIKPDFKIIGRIYSVGLPSIVMQAIGSVMTFNMNKLLDSLNKDSVAVFTVYFKVQSLFFMPIFGLNNGMVPILAYNYGAKKRDRMVSVIKRTMFVAFCFLLVGFIAFETIPDKLLLIFKTGNESLITLGVPAFRMIAVHFLLAWFCIIGLTVFQALGNGIYSLIIAVARQLIILLPVANILARIGGLNLIWWCFPIAELMSFALTAIFLYRINKKIISKV